MGVVYQCTHTGLKQPKAIKLLLPDYAGSDPYSQLRLRREALAACRVNHRNVVRIEDIGTNVVRIETEDGSETHDELFVIMELLEGETLKEYLSARKTLPLDEAIEIARQIAEGLHAIHRQGVLYRDMKPANVMLTHDYEGNRLVKIFDFGAVKFMGESSEQKDADITGSMFVGSELYASPENSKNAPQDERSDVYSLGLVLYEMLEGHPPFPAGTLADLLWSHAYKPAPEITNVPAPLARLVASSLDKDPKARPQTAADFARYLREVETRLKRDQSREGKDSQTANDTSETAGSSHDIREHGREEETKVVARENGINTKRQHVAPVSSNGGGADNSRSSIPLQNFPAAALGDGQYVSGIVLQVRPEGVFVNLGTALPGLITWEEITGHHRSKTVAAVKPGQRVRAVIKKSNGTGEVAYLAKPQFFPIVNQSASKQSRSTAGKQHQATSKDTPINGSTPRGIASSVFAIVLLAVLIGGSWFVLSRLAGRTASSNQPEVDNTSTVTPPATIKSAIDSEIGDELVTVTDVNIRSSAGGKSEKIGLAEEGSRVRVLNKKRNWLEVLVLSHGRQKKDPDSADQGWVDGTNLKPAEDAK
jgi:serine/threonine protein kinase